MNTVTINVGEDGIAILAVNVPSSANSLLAAQLQTGLCAAVEQVAGNSEVQGAILSLGNSVGTGDDLSAIQASGITAIRARDLSRAVQQIVRRMESFGKPFAAAIEGSALGGCLDLALGCHYRVLANDSAAAVGFPEALHGSLPCGGGTQRLPRLIGVQRALPLLLNGNPVAPAEALSLGIVHSLAPAGRTIDFARAWLLDAANPVQPWDRKGFVVPGGAGPLASFASQSFMVGTALVRKQAPARQQALLAILSCVYEGTITGFDTGLKIEANYFGKALSEPTTRAQAS